MILLATLANLIPYLFSAIAEAVWLWRVQKLVWPTHLGLVFRSLLTFALVAGAIIGTGWSTIGSGLILLGVGLPVYGCLLWKKK